MKWELQDLSDAYERIFQMFIDLDDQTKKMYVFKGGHRCPQMYHIIEENTYGSTTHYYLTEGQIEEKYGFVIDCY